MLDRHAFATPLFLLVGGCAVAGGTELPTPTDGAPPDAALPNDAAVRAPDAQARDAQPVDASVAPSDSGAPIRACEGVSCGDSGRCVPVDGEATCACDRDFYRVGLTCVADPCESGAHTGRCFYVDSREGDDDAPGTRDRPKRTMRGALSLSPGPGDYVLFRRGGAYRDAQMRLTNLRGTEEAPITFGAYGEGARPRVSTVRLSRTSHVTLRDFESEPRDETGPCVDAEYSDHLTYQNLEAHGCFSNGLQMKAATSYGVFIDNVVYDIGRNDALVVHDPSVVDDTSRVGDHFWFVDNRVRGSIPEQGIDVATGNDDFDGSRDIKIVGNVVGAGTRGCVVIAHGASVGWVVGNVLGNCPQTSAANALRVGGFHGARSGTDYRVRGNVIFMNVYPSFDFWAELRGVRAWVSHNTFVTVIGERPVARVDGPASYALHHNILWTTEREAHVALQLTDSRPGPATTLGSNHNWFVPGRDGCVYGGRSLDAWTRESGFDEDSRCAHVPGLSEPTAAEASDIDRWVVGDVLDRFIPDPSWEGCDSEVGAFTCDGRLRVAFEPIDGYPVNGGLGWEGPLAVRQRYPLRPTP